MLERESQVVPPCQLDRHASHKLANCRLAAAARPARRNLLPQRKGKRVRVREGPPPHGSMGCPLLASPPGSAEAAPSEAGSDSIGSGVDSAAAGAGAGGGGAAALLMMGLQTRSTGGSMGTTQARGKQDTRKGRRRPSVRVQLQLCVRVRVCFCVRGGLMSGGGRWVREGRRSSAAAAGCQLRAGPCSPSPPPATAPVIVPD